MFKFISVYFSLLFFVVNTAEAQHVITGISKVGKVNISHETLPKIIWLSPDIKTKNINKNEIIFKVISKLKPTITVNGKKLLPKRDLEINAAKGKVFYFHRTGLLKNGENTVIIKAKNAIGISENKQIIYYLPKKNNQLKAGKNYALIIGVSTYQDKKITDLQNLPTNDATQLAQILVSNYTFDSINTILLLNPTRSEIVKQFNFLQKNTKQNDNVLIFYAGHGYYEKKSETGYWLPSDSEIDFTSNWLYNSQIISDLRKIKAKHILLISDACFGGSIFLGRGLENNSVTIEALNQLKSRVALTSGALETVPNKSLFFQYLYDFLQENKAEQFSDYQLFKGIENALQSKVSTNAQFGHLPNTNDQGGNFIFTKK